MEHSNERISDYVKLMKATEGMRELYEASKRIKTSTILFPKVKLLSKLIGSSNFKLFTWQEKHATKFLRMKKFITITKGAAR